MNVGYPGPVCNNRTDPAGLTGKTKHPDRGHEVRPLDGQQFVGISFDARNLYFARFCAASPISCKVGRFGAFRYSLRTARYSLARFGRRLTGFSYDAGGRAYEVLAPDAANGYCGNSIEEAPLPLVQPDCQIVLSDPLTFARDRALR